MSADAIAPAASLTVAYRVRFDESDPDGALRTSAILRYAQDCAWVHSERLGFGRDWYAARGRFWLVRSVELVVHTAVLTGAVLDVTTTVVGFRRVWARRRTTLAVPGGSLVATVDTDWVMTDEAGAPARVPDEFLRLLPASGSFEPHRVALPAAPPTARRHTILVRRQELDPMAHANNATYVDWVEELVAGLDDGARRLSALPRTYRLQYVLPAACGDRIEALAWPLEGPGRTAAIALTSPAGESLRATLSG